MKKGHKTLDIIETNGYDVPSVSMRDLYVSVDDIRGLEEGRVGQAEVEHSH